MYSYLPAFGWPELSTLPLAGLRLHMRRHITQSQAVKKTMAPSKLLMITHSMALSEIKDLIENSYNYRTKTMMLMMMMMVVIMMVTTTTMMMIVMMMMKKKLLIMKPYLKLFSQSKHNKKLYILSTSST